MRFLLAGGCASALNWAVRFPLSQVLPFGAAVGCAYAAGMVVGFVLYRRWVFDGAGMAFKDQVPRFLLVNGVGFVIVTLAARALLPVIAAVPGAPPALAEAAAHALAIALGAVATFLGHRSLTFAARRPLRSDLA